MTEGRWSALIRYAVAGAGPVAGAGAQFVLSLLLLAVLAPADFGRFSFLLTTSFFAAGLWSALFCAPLPVLMNQGEADARDRSVRAMMAVNLACAGLTGLLFFGITAALGLSLTAATLFAAYQTVFLTRWFARAHAYAVGAPLRTMLSDLVYAACLAGGVGALTALGLAAVETCMAALLVSASIGLAPFGYRFAREQIGALGNGHLRHYGEIWRIHSQWSFLGVVTTEATVNAHVYIVTLVSGPTAYAPIAATALMIRPINVAQNALGEFERTSMARQIGRGDRAGAVRAVGHFRLALLAAWLLTAVALLAVFVGMPQAISSHHYPQEILVTGAILWMAVAALRMIRLPESVLLQAAGKFRGLARASVVSCGISIAGVAILLAALGPLWSIGGILLGELIFASLTWREAHRWRRS